MELLDLIQACNGVLSPETKAMLLAMIQDFVKKQKDTEEELRLANRTTEEALALADKEILFLNNELKEERHQRFLALVRAEKAEEKYAVLERLNEAMRLELDALKAKGGEGKPKETAIPDVLTTEKARRVLDALCREGVLEKNWQVREYADRKRRITAEMKGTIAIEVSSVLDLPNCWQLFSSLWGYTNVDSLRVSESDGRDKQKIKEFRKRIRGCISDL